MNLAILLGVVGPWQLIIVLVALLFLFGGKKIPELMKGLGEGIREFKKSSSGEADNKNVSQNVDPSKDNQTK